MNVLVKTLGCERRSLESERFKEYFYKNGCQLVSDPSIADVILYSTCGFDGVKEDQTLQELLNLTKYKAKVIVAGCLPAINKRRLDEAFAGESLTPADPNRVDEFFPNFAIKLKDVKCFNIFNYMIGGKEISSTDRASSPLNLKGIYNICIGIGCDRRCTYCGEWPAWGPCKSKPVAKCVAEFLSGVNAGYKEFNILADSIGPYGHEFGYSLPRLLSDFLRIPGDYHLHLTEYNVLWIHRHLAELRSVIRTGKIKSILCAIQSGSDRILALMDRGYTAQQVQAVKELKMLCPEIMLHTQVIIGFPTETYEDFKLTMSILEQIKFTSVTLYTFDAKPGTAAAAFAPQVPEETKHAWAREAEDKLSQLGTICYYYPKQKHV